MGSCACYILKINNCFKKTVKGLTLWRPITNRQQNPKSYTKVSEPSLQDATRTRNDTMMERRAWVQPSTVAMVSKDPEHIYMAILSQNTEIRSCVSVPKACLSLFLMIAVNLLDWVCRRAPKQGDRKQVFGVLFCFTTNPLH